MVSVEPEFVPRAMYKMLLYVSSLVSLPVVTLGVQQMPLADQTSSPFTSSFDKLVSQNLDHWHTPGLAIAVIHGEDTFSKVRNSLCKIIGGSVIIGGSQ